MVYNKIHHRIMQLGCPLAKMQIQKANIFYCSIMCACVCVSHLIITMCVIIVNDLESAPENKKILATNYYIADLKLMIATLCMFLGLNNQPKIQYTCTLASLSIFCSTDQMYDIICAAKKKFRLLSPELPLCSKVCCVQLMLQFM